VLPFSQCDPIETERLRLRPFALSDLRSLGLLQRAPEVARYLDWEIPDDLELAHRLDDKVVATQLHGDADRLCLAIEWLDRRGLIGEASLAVADLDDATMEIGYLVHPEHQGRGVAKETAGQLVELAFGALAARRVIARIDARNAASAAVLKATSMQLEAQHLPSERIKGQWVGELQRASFELLRRGDAQDEQARAAAEFARE
jgi:RimJ/RimL family protein N-acetyltransferase